MADRDIQIPEACLADEVIAAYLEGLLDPNSKAASEDHLAACTECRKTLAVLMRLLNQQGQPASTAEEMELTAIQSGWKGRPDPVEVRRQRLRVILGISGVAVVVVLGVLIWQFNARTSEPESGSAVVELLLDQTRPFEARLYGQPYREFERTRAARQSSGPDNDLLSRRLAKLNADSYSMGRFFLLTREFDRAIPLLEEAAAQPGATPAVLNDLGAAYLARGDAASLGKAERELKRALQADARLAPAVFNLALLYERTGDTARAQAEWQRYLLLDPEPGWSGDARSRLR